MRSLTVGGQPEGYAFDAHHYPLMRMLVAAKAGAAQEIPFCDEIRKGHQLALDVLHLVHCQAGRVLTLKVTRQLHE